MIVFGTRGSRLARTQTEQVACELAAATGEEWRLEVIETRGDQTPKTPLPLIGGQGVFTAELEKALRERRIDAAVHSYKDLPIESSPELVVAAIPKRASPLDLFVYDPEYFDDDDPLVPLLPGCRVGTSSLRRRGAILRRRPDLEVCELRGNVPTRLRKVEQGACHGTILAAAGMERLGIKLGGLRRVVLPPEDFTPAPAQGALAVQCREEDGRLRGLLAHIHNHETAQAVRIERRLLQSLGGGCSMPFGALLQSGPPFGHRLLASLYCVPDGERPAAGVSRHLAGRDAESLLQNMLSALRPLCDEPLKGIRILSLRANTRGGALEQGLTVAGAQVQLVALTYIQFMDFPEEQLAPEGISAVAFTSARAAEGFVSIASREAYAEIPMHAVGPATAHVVELYGHLCDAPEENTGGAALAKLIAARHRPEDGTILFPCAKDRHPALEQGLEEAGFRVRAVPVYQTLRDETAKLPAQVFDAVLFTSPSSARAFCARPMKLSGRFLALGPSTKAAMAELDLPCAGIPDAPSAASLVPLLEELHHADPT